MVGHLPAVAVPSSAKSLRDTFNADCSAGKVVGSSATDGTRRGGVDREGVISIDNGALRIQPLIETGWGRAALAYGAYERRNGLALGVYMLNGHNTAQAENLTETFGTRFDRWFAGNEVHRRRQRLLQWLKTTRKRRTLRQFQWWRKTAKDAAPVQRLDENLAVGWFSSEVPADPRTDGSGFVMHATGAENGELWARTGNTCLRTVRSVQNLPIYYVVILREKGAAYYVASVPDANGLGVYPNMRPVAIDPFNAETPVYPGIHQSVLGQIGFRLDTRVYGVKVEELPKFSNWYGTAHAADRIPNAGGKAEVGGRWRSDGDITLLDPGTPSGLIHVLCDAVVTNAQPVGVVWRYQDAENYWELLVADTGCELALNTCGERVVLATSDRWRAVPGRQQSIQVLDDGRKIGVYLDGELLFDKWFNDVRLQNCSGVGIRGDGSFRSFEAHPRSVSIPEALDMGAPWIRKGTTVEVADDFSGPAGSLEGRAATTGSKSWKRLMGAGSMDITGRGSVKIRATAKEPNPGRTAYTVDWDHPEFADVKVNITPAGPGSREHGLCGFILWQDDDNYITINIWRYETYGGGSISCFFHLDGFEDLYDAIWTNVGTRVDFGVPVDLRVAFDGMRYMVFVQDEPVLFRTLLDVYPDAKPFSINKVGLLANWEWGNDTGSVFRDFVGSV